jgi:glycosyltransferase involved in cell wall biosynthesis
LRIGLITDEFNPEGGGAERWTAQFAEHLLEAGHEVHVITFRAANRHSLLQMHVLPDPRSLYRRALAVEAAVGGLGPMVLHDTGTGWSAHVFHPQTGSRLLSMEQEIHSHVRLRRLRAAVSPRLNLRRLRMAQIEARAATQARRVIAVSQRLRGMLVTRHHLDQQVVTVIPNGVDTARFAPERLAPLRAPERARLGVGDELLCLMVAHNLRLKGFDTTLQALERLRRDGIEPSCVVTESSRGLRWWVAFPTGCGPTWFTAWGLPIASPCTVRCQRSNASMPPRMCWYIPRGGTRAAWPPSKRWSRACRSSRPP